MNQAERFTPTGVGTIRCQKQRVTNVTVHPHGRGDNGWRVLPASSGDGSPPRAWGQFSRPPEFSTIRRFTPTGVGTITARGQSTCCPTVHPHGRGDNVSSGECAGGVYGSPPRAWGQCVHGSRYDPICRFTPTGVGTISPATATTRSSPVHPHGRGDNRFSTLGRSEIYGSPPRAWGQ